MVFSSPSHKWLAENFAAIDYWIVGAGSAGCVVARVLAQRGFHVGLIEAGPRSRTGRPAEYLQAFGSAEDWGWKSTPQPALARRQLAQPRGRGPGGCTRINAMIWYPPRTSDLAMLQQTFGHSANDWQTSLATVTRWVQPEPPRWLSPASERFQQTSLPAVDPPQPFQRMTRGGRRRLATDLLATDLLSTDLRTTATGRIAGILTGLVDRIEWDGRRAAAIRVLSDAHPQPLRLTANRGIVLAAGALATPAILQRSGVGPADDLRQLGIEPRIDAPAVGSGLIDHLVMPLVYAAPQPWRFPTAARMADLARWQHAATGPLASNLAECGAVYRLQPPSDAVEFQLHVTPTHYLLHPGATAPPAVTLAVNLCRPRSRGRLWLNSTDPAAMPEIDPGYLSDPQDTTDLVAAIEQTRRLADDAAWHRQLGPPLLPAAAASPQQLLRSISRFAQSLYHPVATCRAGTGNAGTGNAGDGNAGDGNADADRRGTVVDRRGRVHGAERLTVIDASILPDIPSINPNATIMTLAHRLAHELE